MEKLWNIAFDIPRSQSKVKERTLPEGDLQFRKKFWGMEQKYQRNERLGR